ncbi:hypothetical protein LJC32_06125, partial [Oscillospiraceae bacterium OttesenSCG-928-F05]|nr:hypothetical protein [Oscillospiraceae bacterium OttesenSCG-928-F05]
MKVPKSQTPRRLICLGVYLTLCILFSCFDVYLGARLGTFFIFVFAEIFYTVARDFFDSNTFIEMHKFEFERYSALRRQTGPPIGNPWSLFFLESDFALHHKDAKVIRSNIFGIIWYAALLLLIA